MQLSVNSTRTQAFELHITRSVPIYHIESSANHIDVEKVNIFDREPRWFERGVKEAIYIRINQPTLNKDGGRYKLPIHYEHLSLKITLKKLMHWNSHWKMI